MTQLPIKFGAGESDTPRAFRYPDIWARAKTTGPDRLIIAPSRGHMDVFMALMRAMPEPFLFLYVLVVPRADAEEGRYETPERITRGEGEAFLRRFEQFFENDGRHNLWLRFAESSDLIVYDRHNVLYAYGNLQSFEEIVLHSNMKKVADVRFPDPHAHCYNSEFDKDQTDLLNYWEWKRSPLHPADKA